MEAIQRKMSMVTSMGKRYTGMVDVPSETYRTTDLINNATIFWKDGSEKIYDDAILMRDARIFLDEKSVYKKYDRVQIKVNEIIYLYDDAETVGDEMEKKRAASMVNSEVSQRVHIITPQVSNSFYEISGILYGFLKKKAKDLFIPITDAEIHEIVKRPEKWVKRPQPVPHSFICVNNRYVESLATL